MAPARSGRQMHNGFLFKLTFLILSPPRILISLALENCRNIAGLLADLLPLQLTSHQESCRGGDGRTNSNFITFGGQFWEIKLISDGQSIHSRPIRFASASVLSSLGQIQLVAAPTQIMSSFGVRLKYYNSLHSWSAAACCRRSTSGPGLL